MDVMQMTITELKALAYDEIARLEQTQKNLQIINNRITEKVKEEQNKPKEEVKK